MIDWDAEGRMWVVEMPGYMPDINAKQRTRSHRANRRPRGHERRRQDGQADGVPRRSGPAAGAEGARPRRARRGAAESLAVRDTNGDLRADSKELVSEDVRPARGQRRAQRQQPALGDGQLDLHLRDATRTSASRTASSSRARRCPRGQWGATQDDVGRIFRNTNSRRCTSTWCPTRYYLRNPNLARTRGSYESSSGRTAS